MPSPTNIDEFILTIAIPTYNGKHTIGRMLDLLMPQIDNRVEIIISDNFSDEESVSIISEYTQQYPLINYVRNDKNIGADSNFLQCMRIAKGKYILLLSDDDILVEGALKRILHFLESNVNMGLVYLSTANFYTAYQSKEKCVYPITISDLDLCTNDKKQFIRYAYHYWGFVSSFIILRESFKKIDNPEQYFGTYWLQSYVHILCADSPICDRVGVIGGLCIAAGVYLQQSNLDTALVDGVNYRKMLDFACMHGFDKKQLDRWYVKRICLLASHALVKEKAAKNKIINKKLLFKCTKKYLKAWFKIYPIILIPSNICWMVLGMKRKSKGSSFHATLNRIGDQSSII